jgi:hypothetical protein
MDFATFLQVVRDTKATHPNSWFEELVKLPNTTLQGSGVDPTWVGDVSGGYFWRVYRDGGIAFKGRYICMKENPWTPKKGRACHPDAFEVGEQKTGWPSGDIVTYECPHCGKRFREEISQ